MVFTLDASSLSQWQSCKRKYVINRDYVPRKWRPKNLLAKCLREAIFQISNGADAVKAADDARVAFLRIANEPGLDYPDYDTYQISKDMCAVMDVVIRCISKLVLLAVEEADDIMVSGDVIWKTLCWQDESGLLHRWVFLDKPDNDKIITEGHSWYVAGDIMLSRLPMTLHVVDIGRMRQGRFRSPWTTAYVLSMLPNTDYHFLSPRGEELKGKWNPKYLSDQAYDDYDEWADRIHHEGMAMRLIQHIPVKCPEISACNETDRMVVNEAHDMRDAILAWNKYPMNRGSCDLYSACPHQNLCYSVLPVNIASSSLYIPRKTDSVLA